MEYGKINQSRNNNIVPKLSLGTIWEGGVSKYRSPEASRERYVINIMENTFSKPYCYLLIG